MEKITKETKFSEILEMNPDAAELLMEEGLFCGGCPMSQFETVEQGANVHGIEVEELLEELNRKFVEK